jgi:hypothetical protein
VLALHDELALVGDVVDAAAVGELADALAGIDGVVLAGGDLHMMLGDGVGVVPGVLGDGFGRGVDDALGRREGDEGGVGGLGLGGGVGAVLPLLGEGVQRCLAVGLGRAALVPRGVVAHALEELEAGFHEGQGFGVVELPAAAAQALPGAEQDAPGGAGGGGAVGAQLEAFAAGLGLAVLAGWTM